MRRLFVVGCVVLSAFTVACGEIPPGPTAPDTQAVVATVTPTRVSLVVSPGTLPAEGGTARIFIETGAGTIAAPNVTVRLSTTAGELSPLEVTTDGTGHATVTWSGTTAATVTAAAGNLTGTAAINLLPPPPPAVPDRTPPPAPTPAPTPTPDPTPTVQFPVVTLTPSVATVPTGGTITFTAAVTNLNAGDTVAFYSWNLDGNTTPEATTTGNTRTSAPYTGHGPVIASVTVTTAAGLSATGTVTVIVTN